MLRFRNIHLPDFFNSESGVDMKIYILLLIGFFSLLKLRFAMLAMMHKKLECVQTLRSNANNICLL